MAATSLIVEPFTEQLATDGVTSPWLVLEWLYGETLAAVREGTEKLLRVPGITTQLRK
jgi:hypothetical protein